MGGIRIAYLESIGTALLDLVLLDLALESGKLRLDSGKLRRNVSIQDRDDGGELIKLALRVLAGDIGVLGTRLGGLHGQVSRGVGSREHSRELLNVPLRVPGLDDGELERALGRILASVALGTRLGGLSGGGGLRGGRGGSPRVRRDLGSQGREDGDGVLHLDESKDDELSV